MGVILYSEIYFLLPYGHVEKVRISISAPLYIPVESAFFNMPLIGGKSPFLQKRFFQELP